MASRHSWNSSAGAGLNDSVGPGERHHDAGRAAGEFGRLVEVRRRRGRGPAGSARGASRTAARRRRHRNSGRAGRIPGSRTSGNAKIARVICLVHFEPHRPAVALQRCLPRRRQATSSRRRARSCAARPQWNRAARPPSAAGTARRRRQPVDRRRLPRSPARSWTSENAAGFGATTGRSRTHGARDRSARRCRPARHCEHGSPTRGHGRGWTASSPTGRCSLPALLPTRTGLSGLHPKNGKRAARSREPVSALPRHTVGRPARAAVFKNNIKSPNPTEEFPKLKLCDRRERPHPPPRRSQCGPSR